VIVTEEQITRLRAFAVEPVRAPMSRKESWPSAQGRFIEQAQELSRVRGALREAISIIEELRR
jgi:hypothetical protein